MLTCRRSWQPTTMPPGVALPALGADTWRAHQYDDDEPGHCLPRLDAQKKLVGATERSETARAAWPDLSPHLPPERLTFLDECGCHIALTPLYARTPRDQRALCCFCLPTRPTSPPLKRRFPN
jgi:hypothetical protein